MLRYSLTSWLGECMRGARTVTAASVNVEAVVAHAARAPHEEEVDISESTI